MKCYAEALIFAVSAHNGQFRKYSQDPYILHPIRVSEFLLKKFSHRKDVETLRIAAVLHDVVEDTWVENKDVEKEFGKKIAGLVEELTKDKSFPKKIAAEKYAAKLQDASDQAKIIKLADIYDNIHDTLPAHKSRIFFGESASVLNSIDVDDNVFREIKMEALKRISSINK